MGRIPLVEDDDIIRFPPSASDLYTFPSDVERVPVRRETIERNNIRLTSKDSRFAEGVFVAVVKEDRTELQYKSAYMISNITSPYSSDLYRITLRPTHGNSGTLRAKQAYKYDNKVQLQKSFEYSFTGPSMVLRKVKDSHISTYLRDGEESLAFTI